MDEGSGSLQNYQHPPASWVAFNQNILAEREGLLRKTRKKLREHGLPDANKRLKRCDVRNIASAFKNKFHAILAAYSLDFPMDLQAFRQSIHIVADALEDDAMLVMCISHPTAHPQYPRLINDTMRTSEGALDYVNASKTRESIDGRGIPCSGDTPQEQLFSL